MKGIFLRALTLALLIPAAAVVAVDPVTVDAKATAEVTAKTAEVAKPTEAAKTAEVSSLTKAWDYTKAKASDFGGFVSDKSKQAYTLACDNKLATAGIVAASAGLGYGLYRTYRHFYPKSEDKNVASSKAAGSNDLDARAKVEIPTIKVELIKADIDALTKLVAAVQAKEASVVAKTIVLEKLEAVKQIVSKNNKTGAREAGLVTGRLSDRIRNFDSAVLSKDAKAIAFHKTELVKYVNATITKLNFVMSQQAAPKVEAAVAAAKTAAPAAATNSEAPKSTWETVKSYATLKTAAVVAATATGLGLGYYYFPTIKAALGFGKEVASTAVVANEAAKLVAKEEAPKATSTK